MDNLKNTDYLHFGPDGYLKGFSGVSKDGEFTIFNDLENKNILAVGNNNLYYTGDKICIDDICLDKNNLKRMSSFFNIELSNRISDNFYDQYKELINKTDKNVNDIFIIVQKLIDFYSKLKNEEKLIFLEDVFHNKIRLPKLGVVIDQKHKSKDLMDILKRTDINISRMEYKIDKIDVLNINSPIPFYELNLSSNEEPTKLIVFFDNMKIRFSFVDYYILQDLEYQYFSIYREKNLLAIQQVDNISIFELRPHDLKLLVDNIKSISIIDGIYKDNEYLKSLFVKLEGEDSNNFNIDVYKLDALLYFPNEFIIKEFTLGEYESYRERINNYLIGTLISKYIYLGMIDNYEVRLFKGEKNDQLSSKWKIYLKKV